MTYEINAASFDILKDTINRLNVETLVQIAGECRRNLDMADRYIEMDAKSVVNHRDYEALLTLARACETIINRRY